jgi:gliding motility-associated-like protein
MKKCLITLTLLFCLFNESFADHIKGGFFTYEYLGPGVNNPSYIRYKISLYVYMRCGHLEPGQVDDIVNITFFNAGTNAVVQTVSAPRTAEFDLSKVQDDQCISGNQAICFYHIVVYTIASIELAALPNGYSVAFQRCCRIGNMQNIVNSGNVGITYTITIPGTSAPANAVANSSAQFLTNDTVVVCHNKNFSYSFHAVDPDGDSLSYSVCDALSGGGPTPGSECNNSTPNPACTPFASVPYAAPYSGSQPLGAQVTINPKTGVISGVAPTGLGEYVVTVCVTEFRNGVPIASNRKDMHVRVENCELVEASLKPQYITCDGYVLTFSNNSSSSLIQSYYWDFGVTTLANDTSNIATPTYTYPDTGTYTVKLVVNKGLACSDSATSITKVYPGFFPDFTNTGNCLNSPVQFNDLTKTNYGVVDSWSWNFGDLSTLADTSHIQNPGWTYPDIGTKIVTLIATNSKGCKDSVAKTVNIIDKPPISVAFRDTLICVPDTVRLQAIGTGNFSWTPLISITNANTATPTVNPTSTTTYHVELENGGCRNHDSVKVRVITSVSVIVWPDTAICLTDPVQLNAVTNGRKNQWTTNPASAVSTLSDPAVLNPVATPTDTVTTYQLRSSVGSCTSTAELTIRAVPYPVANAGRDTTICYHGSAQLNGSHNGTSFTWSPANYLNNLSILNPIAFPPATTSFVLTVYSNQGCPKPGKDTMLVTVLPKIKANAGRDTMVVVGQPLEFQATGGERYLWSPGTSLSSTTISNPIGVYDGSFDSIQYKVKVYNEAGCVDSAFITVKIFKTNPSIFVPNAFTPNGDGRNDLIRPIGAGVQKINYFRIFNRWGQMVFSTSVNGHGWDGTINGVPQNTGTYVWIVSAIDYLGKPYFGKGTVTLIR